MFAKLDEELSYGNELGGHVAVAPGSLQEIRALFFYANVVDRSVEDASLPFDDPIANGLIDQ